MYNSKVKLICRCDGIGRRSGLKIHRWRQRAGSSPATGTKKSRSSERDFFIQYEGLVCNRCQAYVICLPCKRYVIKSQDLYAFPVGLITYHLRWITFTALP